MLYVFVGNDAVGVRARAHAYVVKNDITTLERITVEKYAPEMFREHLEANALFGDLAPLLIDFPSEDAMVLTDIEESIPDMAATSRMVILVDTKPKAAFEKALKKHAVLYEEVLSKEGAEQRFNTFTLADALARKDKKSLWVLLMRARASDIASEEIIGTLFWQIKTLRTVMSASSAEEVGMKDFVYKKAKAAVKSFTKEELESLSERLLSVYHDGHFDKDIEVGLERWVLAV